MKHFIILGAGISGLSLAWFLKRRFENRAAITILEKQDRAGGWIRSANKDGFLFELGPRGCRPKGNAGRETLLLIEELGLQNEVISADPASKYRYLLLNKRLRQLPKSIFSFLTFPLSWEIVKGIIKDWKTPPSEEDDETIREFISRRFSDAIADKLFDPLTTGIYGGDIRNLSMRSCFPKFVEWERSSGSVIKGALFGNFQPGSSPRSAFAASMGKSTLISFKKGMETLSKELSKQLESHLRLNSPAAGLNIYPNRVEVKLNDGSVVEGDHLFSTLPAADMLPLLLTHRPLSDALKKIPAVSVATVSLGFYKNVLRRKGFGYLVPSSENENIMGMVWDSKVYPEQSRIPEETRLTVMIGGAHFPQVQNLAHKELQEIARKAVYEHLQIDVAPDSSLVNMAKGAIPQYQRGHHQILAGLEAALNTNFRNLTLLGNSFYGVAVNDCIAKSRQIAAQL